MPATPEPPQGDLTIDLSDRDAAPGATDVPPPPDRARWAHAAASAAVVGVTVAVALVGRNRIGHIGYTLDDSYIHLRVSEMIRHGHYGLELGSASSPASSVVWPFLLAPFAGWSRHYEVPLLLNLVCVAGLVAVACALLRRTWTGPWRWFVAPAAAVLCVATNVVGAALTGMEHTLQTLMVLTIGVGIGRALRGEPYAWWCWTAIAVAPLVRYESALVSIAGLGVAWLLGERRRVVVAAGAMVTGLAAFSVFLVTLGLDPLPSSILAKTRTGLSNINDHGGVVPYLAAAALAVTAWALGRRDRVVLTTAGAVLFVYAGHMVGGVTDEVRYSTSVNAFAVLMLASVLPSVLPRGAVARGASFLAIIALLAVPATRAVDGMRIAPEATQQIAEQQCEMHQFVVDHLHRPVAANDIGCISYRNPWPVLDLWGLASQEARKERLAAEPGWLERLVRNHDIDVAIIYAGWFGTAIPPTWVHVGSLTTASKGYAAAATVDVYATHAGAVPDLQAALWAFRNAPGHPGTTVDIG